MSAMGRKRPKPVSPITANFSRRLRRMRSLILHPKIQPDIRRRRGLGDPADFPFLSNSRNLRIVKRWLDKHHPETVVIEGEVLERRV